MKRGFVYVYTGNGAGKTTAALGLALRAVGHKKKVIIAQFMKGRKDIGEWKVRKRLEPYYEIHQFGRKEFVNLKNPDKKDIELANKGLEFAKEALKRKPFLLILDEINIAAAFGLVDKKDVLKLLKNVPPTTTVVLTGRYAPKEFVEIADFVNEVKDVKHPLRKGIPAIKGIQY
ncbi:MAG TPA: cob(I)yrinic acid a,c-diamide adenosyltransferase [Candidatus Aenigmarchaeota archaeon]|nr:cob(I)yrinic acid a,c-diamide adenosyltransferase [Candidatus Aenigmarchaeota archaeon]